MTAQIGDTVIYQDRDFSLAGINGDGLFDPKQIGLKVVMISTACYDGFYCTYTVEDDSLFLTRLTVGFEENDRLLAENGEGPMYWDKLPNRDQYEALDMMTLKTEKCWGDWYYEGFRHRVAFTGGLLIGDDFIHEMYVHMGYHPAYKYRTVHELIFDDGHLISQTDKSDHMADFRNELSDRSLAPTDPNNRKEIEDWIDRTFSRDYK